MKQIKSISIWDNGQTKEAVVLNAYAINVTLGTSATFYYSLLDANKTQLAQGNLTMSGDAYQEWLADAVAWEWIAKELNLVIEGDWVEPIVEHTEKDKEFINSVLEQLPEEIVNDLTEDATIVTEKTEK